MRIPRPGREAADLRVRPVTVQAQTAAKLRDAILSGVFRPGQRLIEADLSGRMGVSRASVREALRRLEAERLVTREPNRGPSVTEISWPEAKQIYDVRALLEGEAAALFAARARPRSVALLRAALEDFEHAVAANDPLERLRTTQRFYDIILEGCGNEVIAEVLRGLVARITFLRARSMSRPGRSRVSAVELRRMFEAIASGDPRAARAAAIQHVRAAASTARLVFNEQQDAPRAAATARRPGRAAGPSLRRPAPRRKGISGSSSLVRRSLHAHEPR